MLCHFKGWVIKMKFPKLPPENNNNLLSDYHRITLYGMEKSKREKYPLWAEFKKKQWERGEFAREHKKRNTGKPKIKYSVKRREVKKLSGVNITWGGK